MPATWNHYSPEPSRQLLANTLTLVDCYPLMLSLAPSLLIQNEPRQIELLGFIFQKRNEWNSRTMFEELVSQWIAVRNPSDKGGLLFFSDWMRSGDFFFSATKSAWLESTFLKWWFAFVKLFIKQMELGKHHGRRPVISHTFPSSWDLILGYLNLFARIQFQNTSKLIGKPQFNCFAKISTKPGEKSRLSTLAD